MKRLIMGLSLMAAGMMAFGTAAVEGTTEQGGWTAEWIGPGAATRLSLAGASWIWMDEAGIEPTRNAPAGARYFRCMVELPGSATVTAASVLMTADNHFKLVVNGRAVGGGDNWERPTTLDIRAALRPGSNTLVVRVDNDPDAGAINAAGLIGRIRIERADGSVVERTTDSGWMGAVGEQDAGRPVRVIGGADVAPWSLPTAAAVEAEPNQWNCFRGGFMLDSVPKSAVARLAVDSKYWLWVNGKLVVYEGGLKRGPTPQDTYLDRVELAPYLRRGRNTLAVLAWFWGKDGFSHKNSGQAGFLFDMQAGKTAVRSDGSWKMLRHPAYGRTGEPHPNFRMPDENIHFDARLDLGDWMAPAFDDAAWPVVRTFGKPPCAPWNRLIERPIPQWRTSGLLAYANAGALPRVSDGKPVVAKLPINLTISPYLKIKAPAGLTIDMRTDNYKGGGEYNYRAEYVTREGVQEFESLAYLNGHEMIYSIPAGVEILALRYRETRYDTDFAGSFASDDPFLDRLWLKARNTMNVNMRDCIQDPDRERAQWWGDEVILMSQIFHSCDSRGHMLVRKGIDNLVDWQKSDGVLFSPIPAGSWDKELPLQTLASIGLYGFWNYYQHTADQATIVRAYPAVKRYLSLWQLGPDGLAVHRAGGWDWVDWGENIDTPVCENAWLYQALESAINMARLTGDAAAVPRYEAMRASIAANYNKRLWNGSEYRSPGYTGKTDERGHALAVVFGLAGAEQFAAIRTVFGREFHSSPYMEKYVLEALFRMDAPEAALARMKTRYAKMVDSELSTLWEGWGVGPEGYGGGSYNHGWCGGPLTLMMEYVAGVTPTAPGFAAYQVRPQLGPLTRVRSVSHTIKGLVEVDLRREAGTFTLALVSPPGTTAMVCLPCAAAVTVGDVRVNGRAVDGMSGVRFAGRDGDRLRFEVQPGRWTFTRRD